MHALLFTFEYFNPFSLFYCHRAPIDPASLAEMRETLAPLRLYEEMSRLTATYVRTMINTQISWKEWASCTDDRLFNERRSSPNLECPTVLVPYSFHCWR